jgi:NADPH2:quinone reductase
MRAVLCRAFGPPPFLVIDEVPDPMPGPGRVQVAVGAAAVNFPDLLMIEDRYQVKPPMPFSPGGEVAGRISALGPGVEGFRVGDRVMAVCGWGGFAEKIVLPARDLVLVPEGMDTVVAAGFLTAYGTSYHALKDRGRLQPGETLLVMGAAGGVGLAAVELGAAMGAVVIAGASSAAKLEVCAAHGAALGLNYVEEDLRGQLKELTGGRGPDVIYDPVGDRWAEPAFRSLAWNGRYLVVGFAGGEVPRLAMNLPLLKGAELVGVYWGSFTARQPEDNARNLAELAGMWAQGRLDPVVSGVYPLEEAARALEDLQQRRAVGKVVVEVTPVR